MVDLPYLSVDGFSQFFRQVYGYAPFQWQVRMAELACNGQWPRAIKLPTASGKTACLDIAVFALAFQAARRHVTGQPLDAPRRIFFVVDRRIIVNEAYQRACHLKRRLLAATSDSDAHVFPVAAWLRTLAGDDGCPPLDCFELRGGIYRDDAWVRSALQPTILTSTVDQVGSRLLFRGYGVSDRNLPIHAALVANDALLMLDEAHCSHPFRQTIESVARYRDVRLPSDEPGRWCEEPLRTPFQFVEMTATPGSSTAAVFQLQDDDYRMDPALEQRHGCAKPVRLVASNAKGGKQNLMLAKHLVEQAESLARDSSDSPACRRIAIIANRVACARQAFELLRKQHGERVELMIGRMRPVDRDKLTERLQAQFRSGAETAVAAPHFVVATQCLEVGADFDFDGMVSQCANVDALRQRFGRLNRMGRAAHARGMIVMAEGDKAPRKPDPIYGSSLPMTWEWLVGLARDGLVDFGVKAIERALHESQRNGDDVDVRLRMPVLDAPVLMPAHLDLLCQTSPRPAVEPAIAPYLHGPNRGLPEVRVCWRADLPDFRENDVDEWLHGCSQTLSVCPPSSSECLGVPLPQFVSWLRGDDDVAADSGRHIGRGNGHRHGKDVAKLLPSR